MDLNRCCADSIAWLDLRQPIEGVEIACRWCSGYVRFTKGAWVFHESSHADVLPADTAQEASAS